MKQTETNFRIVIICVTLLGILSGLLGTFLLCKGYQGGEILATGMSGTITGLLGMLSMRHPQPGQADATAIAVAPPAGTDVPNTTPSADTPPPAGPATPDNKTNTRPS